MRKQTNKQILYRDYKLSIPKKPWDYFNSFYNEKQVTNTKTDSGISSKGHYRRKEAAGKFPGDFRRFPSLKFKSIPHRLLGVNTNKTRKEKKLPHIDSDYPRLYTLSVSCSC